MNEPMSPSALLPTPTACRTCRAPILWAENVTTGKPAPVDAAASDDGNCHVYMVRSRVLYRVLGKAAERAAAREHGTPLFTNHFQTCPDRADWSGRTGS